MPEIGSVKTSQVREKELRAEREKVLDALARGDIEKLRTSRFRIDEFLEFFTKQWLEWKGQIVQDSEVTSSFGAKPEPNIADFPPHHAGASINKEVGDYFLNSMLRGTKFKAQVVPEGEAAPPDTSQMSPEELDQMARGTLDEWQQFTDGMWSQIMDAQMMRDLKSRTEEVKAELMRIIALARQGIVSPEFILIAMAKVNATKNGVLMTWLGKKTFHVNESMNKIASDLHTLSPNDPRYTGELQMAQSKTRDGAFQMQLLTTDLQKLMQDVASVFEQVHGLIGEINRTRREIIQHVAAR